MRFRGDIARTLGDTVLDHLHKSSGGRPNASVTITPERAAALLARDGHASRPDVSVVRDLLAALAQEKPRAYHVRRNDVDPDAFDIEPTRHAP